MDAADEGVVVNGQSFYIVRDCSLEKSKGQSLRMRFCIPGACSYWVLFQNNIVLGHS
jgi:hypothetical protein